jgi:type VI secretion system protein
VPDPFLDDDDDYFSQAKTSVSETPPPGARQELKDVNTPLSQMDSSLLGSSVSIDDLYNLDEKEKPEPPSFSSQSDQGSVLDHHFSSPSVQQARAPASTPPPADDDLLNKYAVPLDEIPDNWDDDDFDLDDVPEPSPPAPQAAPPAASAPPVAPAAPDDPAGYVSPAAAPEPTQPPQPAAEYAPPAPVQPPPARRAPAPTARSINADSAIAAFAAGAELDLDLLQVPDEEAFFQDLGALLKTMTQGLMQAIASRGQVKSEFRLEQTMIAPTENNPFKFSVSPKEAMMRLINRTDGAYLSGVKAAAEAIDDINAHQLAVMAGTEAALKSILHRFDPEKLETRFSKDSKSVSLLKKARYWDFYKVLYTEISEAVDDDFQQLFGAEFSNAYEQQLDRLKLSRKESSR